MSWNWINKQTRLPKEDVPVLISFKMGMTPLVGMMTKKRHWPFKNRKKAVWTDSYLSELDEDMIYCWTELELPKPELP